MKTLLPKPQPRRNRLATCRLAAILTLATAPVGQAATPSELDAFAANIESSFTGLCTGFGYAIYENGNYVRGNGAGFRYKSDHPLTALPFDENTQKDCHSMSKTITAAAMIRALQLRGIGLDARIYDYFPKVFQDNAPGIPIKLITFEQILSHRSGFEDSAKTWTQLLDELKDGQDSPAGGDSVYCNWNYGICRLLIPYVLYHDAMRDIETKVTSGQLSAGCADLYIEFTRDWILKPAGAFATRTRPPQNPQSVNFAYLYNWNDHDAEGIMPNRRLDIGSGGWAMSSKEYGKFLRDLFDGNLLAPTVKLGNNWVNALDYMKDNELGMFETWGTNGEVYYTHNGANSYSNNSGTWGGQSVWMHFPSSNICAVIQINCNSNEITAAGMSRTTLLRESYDQAMTSPSPSGLAYGMDVFFSRKQDGLAIGRGVDDDGNFRESNFHAPAETGWALTRFFETPQQTFILRYNPDNGNNRGTLQVRKVNPDGTLGTVTYSSDNWTRDWSHLEIFEKNNGADTYLLCYRESDGLLRTYGIETNGVVVGPAITDTTATANYDILKTVRLSGTDHLFRYNSTTGHTHIRQLNNDGSWGAVVYDKNWKAGYPSFNFYTTGPGNHYILRYNWTTGIANILGFDGTVNGIDNTTVVMEDAQWSLNWRTMRFFTTSNGTFNFRYNPETGTVRLSEIRNNGTFGTVVLSSDDSWLRQRSADGPFRPATEGWDTVEFYFAKNVVNQPPPPRAVSPPPRAETGNTGLVIDLPPVDFPRPIPLEPATPITTFLRGRINLNWEASDNVLYFIEKSPDLIHWEPSALLGGNSGTLEWSKELLEDNPDVPGEKLPRYFYRVRTIEGAPDQ